MKSLYFIICLPLDTLLLEIQFNLYLCYFWHVFQKPWTTTAVYLGKRDTNYMVSWLIQQLFSSATKAEYSITLMQAIAGKVYVYTTYAQKCVRVHAARPAFRAKQKNIGALLATNFTPRVEMCFLDYFYPLWPSQRTRLT